MEVKIPLELREELEKNLGKENLKKITFVSSCPYILDTYWEFIFYHNNKNKISDETFKEFTNKINDAISKLPKPKDTLKDLLEGENYEKLRKLYKGLSDKDKGKGEKALHYYGLSMYAGPLNQKSSNIKLESEIYPDKVKKELCLRAYLSCIDLPEYDNCSFLKSIPECTFNNRTIEKDNEVSILYTGDTRLATKKELEAAKNHFNSESTNSWDKVAVLQIPHHGSRYNMPRHIDTIKAFFNHKWSVFSAEPNYGNYNHPSKEVVCNLCEYNPILINKCIATWKGSVLWEEQES